MSEADLLQALAAIQEGKSVLERMARAGASARVPPAPVPDAESDLTTQVSALGAPNWSANHPILLVEDSPEDYEITVRTLRKAKLANPIFRCADGDEALDYLHRRGDYTEPSKAPRPAIILLDLNLPGTDGREVLATVKGNVQLRAIPIVVLTTSADERDIEACYRAGANSYIQKPVDLPGFMAAIQRLKEYWFEIVLIPQQG